MKKGKQGLWSLVLLGLSWAAGAQTVVNPPPIEDFFRAPLFGSPRLSPDGRHLAAIVNQKGNSLDLAVLDIENPGNSKIIAALIEADIRSVHWVNNDRLVFDAQNRIDGEGRSVAQGLWAVDRDGRNLKPWISPSWRVGGGGTQQTRQLSLFWHLFQTLDDGSDNVIIRQSVVDKRGFVTGYELARLDTRTGERKFLTEGTPERGMHWLLDRSGQPAFVTAYDEKGGYATYRRQPDTVGPSAVWQPWESGDTVHGRMRIPLWIGTDRKMLSLGSDQGLRALYQSSNDETDTPAQQVLKLEGHDLNPQLMIDPQGERLLGVHYLTEGPGTTWFDPVLSQAQQDVDALLPDSVNRLDCRRCLASPLMLVTAMSDRQPASYFLFDRASKQLKVLARSRPWIQPAQMGRVQVTRIAARDGLGVPVQVTLPAGQPAGPRPAIVLVHGGPWVRGNHWTWETDAQILASRGYLVIEPEFRGSEGYGFAHFKAGWKQWGLAMQDDVVDATRWAIQQGLADPKRICIAGASYGGYAAMMGVARDGDLYQCAVNWVGVTDIDLLFSRHWSDMGDTARNYRMPVLIGDREAEARRLHDTSPVFLADRIKKPVLMAYGGQDARVPLKHGQEMRDALVKAGNPPEWIVYSDEGHGWRKPANNVDFWTRVLAFLDRQIGKDAPAR